MPAPLTCVHCMMAWSNQKQVNAARAEAKSLSLAEKCQITTVSAAVLIKSAHCQ